MEQSKDHHYFDVEIRIMNFSLCKFENYYFSNWNTYN